MSRCLAFLLLFVCTVAEAQTFPKLTGRVVDAANLLDPAQEAAITNKLVALEAASTRQLVVATVPDLGGNDIAEYGVKLGRAWGIGQAGADNGALLIVAPTERRVRIEVAPGLEPILTDALSSLIIQNQITPAFRNGDYPGGIDAGVDAIVEQLQAPPEIAERSALEAAQAQRAGQDRRGRGRSQGGSIFPLLFWGGIFLFVILPMLRGGGGGRRYGRRHRAGGGLGNVGSILLWEAANAAMRSGQNDGGGFGGFGGGGGGFGGGGGGFSGGGGSFGGGGASGGW